MNKYYNIEYSILSLIKLISILLLILIFKKLFIIKDNGADSKC